MVYDGHVTHGCERVDERPKVHDVLGELRAQRRLCAQPSLALKHAHTGTHILEQQVCMGIDHVIDVGPFYTCSHSTSGRRNNTFLHTEEPVEQKLSETEFTRDA